MSDWVIGLIVGGGFLLLATLIHAIANFRMLMRQTSAVGREITVFSAVAWRQARKLVILVIGGSVVIFGVMLIFLPGPAFVVIPVGLAILAVEFAWARRWLRQLRVTLHLSARRSRRWLRRGQATADS